MLDENRFLTTFILSSDAANHHGNKISTFPQQKQSLLFTVDPNSFKDTVTRCSILKLKPSYLNTCGYLY